MEPELDQKTINGIGDYSVTSSEGMSLRDYFAGEALGLGGEFFHVYSGGYHNPEIIAQTVYKIADAMLKEREK